MQPGAAAGRKTRNWKDIQLILSSISLAITLGLWSMWSTREKRVAAVEGEADLLVETTTAETEPVLLPGQTLYLNAAAPPSATNVAEQKPRRRNRDGGGGGGGGNASTGSS